MRVPSLDRRQVGTLVACTALFSIASLAPLPVAIGRTSAPPTVARTVGVPLARLAGSATETPAVSVCSSIWSTMVALVWRQAGPGRVRPVVTASRSVDVLDDFDAQPNVRSPEYQPRRRTSVLYWTNGTHCVRVSLAIPGGVTVSNLRAQFVNTSGTAAGPGTAPKPSIVSRAAAFIDGVVAPPPADAMTSEPPIVTRAQWGAAAPRKHCLTQNPEIRMAYVHHTSGTNTYSASQSAAIVRGIQYYHEVTRGYCDIAYNFLVDRFGTIFEGRAGSLRSEVRPASQMGFNQDTFSVSAMGNFQTVAPAKVMLHSIERVIAWRLDQEHLDPLARATMTSEGGPTDRYRQGVTVRLPLISGHRQTGVTDCPGNHLWARLRAIRHAVYDLGRPKFFDPSESRTTVTPFTNTDRITATATDPLTWQVAIVDGDGNLVRQLFAHGIRLRVRWDGTDRDGIPAMPGTYTAVVTGMMSSGKAARSAELRVAVDPIRPIPSPSPSP